MSAFDKSRAVEQRGWKEICGLIRSLADGQCEEMFDNPDAQRDGYDLRCAVWEYSKGRPAKLELKVEEENPRGNLFLETWSNKEFGRQKVGWMMTSKADWLLYYFLDTKTLYMIPFKRLWNWFFGDDKFFGFGPQLRQVQQGKAEQLNKTCGVLTPTGDLYRHIGFVEYRNDHGWKLIRDLSCDFGAGTDDRLEKEGAA